MTTRLTGKRGAWINQFALPPASQFVARGKQVDYVVIKYGFGMYERLAFDNGIPWVAERMGDNGAGSQDGPNTAKKFANQLADQALQQGCVAAVINLEEADGGWHHDDGSGTTDLIDTFRARCPNVPLFASLDTRGQRPDDAYQVVCAQRCDGVMPMIYPRAFGQTPARAFGAGLTASVYARWAGKDIIPTFQTYGDISPEDVDLSAAICNLARMMGRIHGANFYTLGHATEEQWMNALEFGTAPAVPAPTPAPTPDIAAALIALRKAWRDGWAAIGEKGTMEEADALLAYWHKLIT